MKTFNNGEKVTLNMKNCNRINFRVYDGINAVVDFQCEEPLGVIGLVYVNFIPKGKRAMRSIAVHPDHLIRN